MPSLAAVVLALAALVAAARVAPVAPAPTDLDRPRALALAGGGAADAAVCPERAAEPEPRADGPAILLPPPPLPGGARPGVSADTSGPSAASPSPLIVARRSRAPPLG